MGTLAQVCRRWRRVALDEVMWKKHFLKHYSVPPSTDMPPGASSWRMEFKRLYDEAPFVTADEMLLITEAKSAWFMMALDIMTF